MNFKIYITVFIISFLLVGCNYKLREIPKQKQETKNAGSDSNTSFSNNDESEPLKVTIKKNDGVKGETLLISETGKLINHNCNETIVELDEDTTSNTINLRGICRKIIVDGVSNYVYAKEVGEIIVRGIGNKVVYESGIGGGKPKISVSGTSTSAKQKEPAVKEEIEERQPKN